jgi:hypothetical protein
MGLWKDARRSFLGELGLVGRAIADKLDGSTADDDIRASSRSSSGP